MKLVELVGPDGTPTGTATVEQAHRAPGLLHRAFSVFLFDPAGRLLLQRRAAEKNRFGGLWTNTCCSHPAPGEDAAVAAGRRLREELALEAGPLTRRGEFVYAAADPGGVWAEHELDAVLTGAADADVPLTPDPAEIDDLRWIGAADLRAELDRHPAAFSPWFSRAYELAVG